MSLFRETRVKKEKQLRGKEKWVWVGLIPLIVLLMLLLLWVQSGIQQNEMHALMGNCARRRLNTGSTEIVIGNKKCDCCKHTVLDFAPFPRLKTLLIGDRNLQSATDVQLVGLRELERVVIGDGSFTQGKGVFSLKDCPRVKSLKIGYQSFTRFTACVIENVDALEEIEIGVLDGVSYNFPSVSLQLKSVVVGRALWLDLPSLKSLVVGNNAFHDCSRAVFESE